MIYVIANSSGDKELAYRASSKREALAWIRRTTANWLGAPVFTIADEAPPCEPQWFDYSVQ